MPHDPLKIGPAHAFRDENNHPYGIKHVANVPLSQLTDSAGNPINPATEDSLAQLVMAITNAINEKAFDLNAAAFSETTNISNDYELDNVEFNFTTAALRTITITTADGTVILNEPDNIDTSFAWVPSQEIAFNGGENLTVTVTQTGTACSMDCVLKVKQGSNTLLGNPVLGAGAELIGIPYLFGLEVSKGNVLNHEQFNTFGERTTVLTTPKGEDVWEGVATEIPLPNPAGEEMQMVSTDVNDTAAGTGARTMEIMYLDGNGDEQIHEQALNGTTPVDITVVDISFVNFFHTDTVGSNGVAHGDITIFKKNVAATVYNIVKANENMSTTCKYKVPNGRTLFVTRWYGTQTGRKPTKVRIRSTDHHGELHPGVFLFKDSMRLDATAPELVFDPPVCIPSMSVIKISAWADQTGGSVSAGFKGYLNN